MKKLDIAINGHIYTLACDDGEEKHVARLAREIDTRAKQIAAATPKASEALILVMTLLLMGDELHEANNQEHELREALKELRAIKTDPNYQVEGSIRFGAFEAQAALAEAMEEMADHIERMAETLEKA